VLSQKLVEQVGLRGGAATAAPKGRNILAQGAALGKEWPLTPPSAPLSRRPAARRSLTLQSFSNGALWAAGRAGEGKGERKGASTHGWRRGLRYVAPSELNFSTNF